MRKGCTRDSQIVELRYRRRLRVSAWNAALEAAWLWMPAVALE